MPRRLLILGALTFALSIVGAMLAGRGDPAVGAEHTRPAPRVAGDPVAQAQPQYIGMTLNVYYTSQIERDLAAIDRIHETGFNTVQIVTPIFQTDGASEQLRAPFRPGRSPSPEQLVRLLDHAHKLGMRTILMPQINFTKPRGNEWRGKIHPEDWRVWWQNYDKLMDRYLDIAIKGHADVFTVGCELVSTLDGKHLDQWQKLIDLCRSRFKGKLTFSTTWDSYDRVNFWQDLDYIGISGYWNLTTKAADPQHPKPSELAARWADIRQRLLTFAKAAGRPILITELGYPSLKWGLKDPWNYVNSDHAKADPAVQAAGYRSFLSAWEPNLTPPQAPAQKHPYLAGVLFYEWNVTADNPLDDTGYSIFGKPAYDIVHHWLMRHSNDHLVDR